MPETRIQPITGTRRFKIKGPRNIEMDLGSNDPKKYAVMQKDLNLDLLPKKFSEDVNITWLAAYGVRKINSNGSVGDFADVRYTITLDALPANSRLFYYIEQTKTLVEITEFTTNGNRTKFDLTVGDPPIGFGP